jgi:hypothetical protein
MKREVHSEQSDRVFRNKILKQEQAPLRAGETPPPAFDWSAMPAPNPGLSTAQVLWSGLVLIAAALVLTLVVRYQMAPEPETPLDENQTMSPSHMTTTDPVSNNRNSKESRMSASHMTTASPMDETQEPKISRTDDAQTSMIGQSGESDYASNASEGVAGGIESNNFSVSNVPSDTDLSQQDNPDHGDTGHRQQDQRHSEVINTENTINSTADELVVPQSKSGSELEESSSRKTERTVGRLDKKLDGRVEGSGTALENNNADGIDVAEHVPSAVTSMPPSRNVKVEALTLIPGIENASSVRSSEEQFSQLPEIIPAAQLKARNRFELRLFTSVNKGFRTLSGNGRNEAVVDKINNRESAAVNFGFGLQLGWKINSRWTILTGISKRTTTINYNVSKRIIYDKAKEILNNSGDFENSAEFEFETSAGRSNAITRYAWRLAQQKLRPGDQIDFSFKFEREYQSIVIPLQVQYDILNSAFKIGVIAGAQYARIYKSQLRAERPRARIRHGQQTIIRDGRDFFTKNTFDVLVGDRAFNRNIVEAAIGLHLSYQISRTLDIYLQPSYSHGLNKLFVSDNFSTVPTNKQIDAGIILKF